MVHFLSAILTTVRRLLGSAYRSGLGLILGTLLSIVLIGAAGYAWLEGWSFLDALYATVITVTTVGYGDLTPRTPAGRIFAIFFTIIAIGLVSYAISALAATVIQFKQTKTARLMRKRRMKGIADLKDHIIVCGGNVLAHRIANEFYRRDADFIFIEPDEDVLKWALLWMHEGYVEKRMRHYASFEEIDLETDEQRSIAELADEMGVLYLLEDPTDEKQLGRAGLGRAAGLIAAQEDDRDNIAIVLSARDMIKKLDNPSLRIIARVSHEMNMRRLYLDGPDKVVAPNFVGGFQMATYMLDPVVGEFWDQMLYERDQLMRFINVRAADRPAWVGQPVQALNRPNARLVVAIKRADQYIYAPSPDEVIKPEDIIVIIGSARAVET
jgi:voltage-gated potassium channel